MQSSAHTTEHVTSRSDPKEPERLGFFSRWFSHGAGLEDSARQCAEARCTYTEKLGAATGDDVIRYLVVLNCIECQGYVTETKIQAHRSFRHLVRFAALGFFTVVGGAVMMMIPRTLRGSDLTVIAGVMMQLLSGIFLALHLSASRRMERFHTSLRGVQETVLALYVRGLLGDGPREEQSREIISALMKSGTRPPAGENGAIADGAETRNEGDRRAAPLIAIPR
jgi:hypothetical protein